MNHSDHDLWLNSVRWFCHYYNAPCHNASIMAGLPLVDGQLNTELFGRACQQAELEAIAVSVKSPDLINLPAVAIDTQNKPLIIISLEQQQIQFIDLTAGEAIERCNLATLTPRLSGHYWLVNQPRAKDPRVETLHKSRPAHWLRQAINEVKPWYRDLLLASVFINLLALVVPLFTMNVYDRVVPNQAFNTLWTLAAGVTIALIFDWILRKSRSQITDMAGRQIDNKLSSTLMQRVLGMRLENRPQSVGAFARQIQEFDSVREFFTSVTLVAVVDLPFTLLFLLLIGWLGGIMMAVPIIAMMALIILSFMLKGKIQESLDQSSRLSTQRHVELLENLTHLDEFKQNNAQGECQRRWEQTIASLSDWQIRSRQLSNLVSHSIVSSQQLVSVSLIIIGVYQIAQGLLSMGGLIAIVMLSGRAASAINQFSMLLLRYEQCRSAIEGVDQVMALPQESQPQQQTSQTQFKGGVELQNVSFTYSEQPHPALCDINLLIQPGERVGIIGNAGAGKSTLMALLAGQQQPTQGQISFDGIDSRLWPLSLIRSHTGWLAQSTRLIFGSIYQNITLGSVLQDDEQLRSVVRLAGLDMHLERLPNGLETQVGENGMALSGGQRQSVALARALYRAPNLLLLDEPTTGLDQPAQGRLIQRLFEQPRGATLVICSHQPALLRHCDRLLVLERGKIVGNDKPDIILGLSKHRKQSVNIVRGPQQ